MVQYRRYYVGGGTYFFTVNLLDRKTDLLVQHIDTLRASFRRVRSERPFTLDAIVVLPDHLHAVLTLPEGDADFMTRWRLIKYHFSHALPKTEDLNEARAKKGERGIWQRRFWEHLIRDERDFQSHVDYVHFNPLKHGLVHRVCDWPSSSFHRWVTLGVYPANWAGEDHRSLGQSEAMTQGV